MAHINASLSKRELFSTLDSAETGRAARSLAVHGTERVQNTAPRNNSLYCTVCVRARVRVVMPPTSK